MTSTSPTAVGTNHFASVPEPLVVRPRDACRLLSVGNTRLYQLIGAGELESYHDGRGRRITVESIRRYIARRLAAGSATGAENCSTSPLPRRRGRPRKRATIASADEPAAFAATDIGVGTAKARPVIGTE